MYISDFEIRNFKSFREPGPVKLKPGFNIITGQNSVGKTALLEALTMRFLPNPHRSVLSVPVPGDTPLPISSAKMTIVMASDEFKYALGRQDRYFPRPILNSVVPRFGAFEGTQQMQERFIDWLFSQPSFNLTVRLDRRQGMGDLWTIEEPTMGLYGAQPAIGNGQRAFILVTFDATGRPVAPGGGQYDQGNNVCIYLAQDFSNKIYRFSAERFNVGQSGFGHNPVLSGNAQNLPEVLIVLQSNTHKFLELIRLVHEVLPQVQHVSVRALPGSQIEVIVWSNDPSSKREDLAVPLNQCGSGVGQVLAMLYVVTTATFPQTIIVDEPQSFLHPGAIRKLIDILKRYPQHQYIFATHSPTVITASDPSTLLMVRQVENESTVAEIDLANKDDLRSYLSEIGARLEDVFGSDNVLWVEGRTEEICFPRILKVIGKRSLMGTAILGIRQTGDLVGRDSVRVFELYRRLTSHASLLPPTVAFVLDSECFTREKQTELDAMGLGRVKFLPLRMYENYLLDPQSIALTINQISGFRETPVTEEEVRTSIDEKRAQLDYFCPGTKAIPSDWRKEIDGAKVLKEIFNEKSNSRVGYVKTKHSVAITETMLAHKPGELKNIADWLIGLLPAEAGTRSSLFSGGG